MSRSAAAYQKFTEDEIRKANSVDILSLARGYGYEPEKAGRKAVHMKHSGGLYIFPENNRFFQWTGPDDGVKGGAIDFVMREENLSFPEAVGKLIGKEFSPSVKQVVPYEKKEREPLVLPEKADNMKRAYWYLVSVRGISPKIVSHFMNRKMIYQEKKYGNCVFVGYDAEGTARYCSMRAARDNSSFKMDATGSDKSYPFFHEGKTDLLIVTEAPIDLMSHASIAADFYGRDWMQDHRISTGCLWNGAIDRYLEGHPQIKRLVFAVDNDYLARDKNGQLRNWGQLTAAKWMKAYTEKGYACAVHVPHLNDFNTDLVEMRKGRSVEDLDRQRMAELETAFEQSAEEEPEQGVKLAKIKTFELDRWSEPDEKRRVRHIGMADAKETFDRLQTHLELKGLLPDEYFLFSDELTGELPEFDQALCIPNFGASEGIYLDISLACRDKDGKRYFQNFATGKTLGETADDYYRMFRIAAECSLMLNGRGNTYEQKKVDIVLTEQEAEAVGTVVDMELCGHHPPEAEAILNSALEKIDLIAFAKVQTITCHGKDDYSLWLAEIPKDMLHSILREACERVGTLDELMGAMNPKDGYEMRLFIQTPGRQFAFYRIPERLSNLEDYANEGCSVRGTKDEIMAEIFTEWAPAQEDLEDDFEL